MRLTRILPVLALALAAHAASMPRPLALRADADAPPRGPPPRDPAALPPWLAPDTSTWWQRAAAAWRRGWRGAERLQPLTVRPLLPGGALGDPAELWLPPSQIARERPGLTPLPPQPPAAGAPPPASPAPWHAYNSSAATPLVPTALSWMTDSGAMAERATSGAFDLGVAHALSRLVAAAYCGAGTLPLWNCSRCDAGFAPRAVIFDPLWDLQGFVGWSDPLDAVVVAFRGTDSRSYYNWVENMRTWRTDLALTYEGMPPRALVHGGFFYSYNASYLAANVSAAVGALVAERARDPRGGGDAGGGEGGSWSLSAPAHGAQARKKGGDADGRPAPAWAPTVYVAGHSLGGALATLAALDLKVSLGLPDVRVVSFGSPRVGNYVFAKWFEAEIGPHWRFTHNRDIVPSVPPGYMGFYHVAQEVWMVDVLAGRTLVGVCDGSGEDPRCHSSVCHLGLCSSVADHLMYLSPMYTPRPPAPGC